MSGITINYSEVKLVGKKADIEKVLNFFSLSNKTNDDIEWITESSKKDLHKFFSNKKASLVKQQAFDDVYSYTCTGDELRDYIEEFWKSTVELIHSISPSIEIYAKARCWYSFTGDGQDNILNYTPENGWESDVKYDDLDKSELQSLYDKWKNRRQGDCDDDDWEEFQEFLEFAGDMLEEASSQSDIDSAYENLADAIESLGLEEEC